MTLVSEVMTRGIRSMALTDSVQQAARVMDELNVGVLPVCDGDRLVGVITDRDITIRGVARGCPAEATPVHAVMTADPQSCFEDEQVDDVVLAMRDEQIRRVPVLDRDHHVVGMLTLGDVAARYDAFEAGLALAGISEPAMPQRQPRPDPGPAPTAPEGNRVPGLLRS